MASQLVDEFHNLSLCEAAETSYGPGRFPAWKCCRRVLHKFDPIYHAFVRPDCETALARAHRLDAMRWAREVLEPLHGVWLAHKDMYCHVARFRDAIHAFAVRGR